MRFRQPILKAMSIVMLFVMMQKVAGGLYLHNWLHTSKNLAEIAQNAKAVGQYNCSCIDDFYIPFTEPAQFSVLPPASVHIDYFTLPEHVLPVVGKYFHSLRAPPMA